MNVPFSQFSDLRNFDLDLTCVNSCCSVTQCGKISFPTDSGQKVACMQHSGLS